MALWGSQYTIHWCYELMTCFKFNMRQPCSSFDTDAHDLLKHCTTCCAFTTKKGNFTSVPKLCPGC